MEMGEEAKIQQEKPKEVSLAIDDEEYVGRRKVEREKIEFRCVLFVFLTALGFGAIRILVFFAPSDQSMTTSFLCSLVGSAVIVCIDTFFQPKYAEPRRVCLSNVDGDYGFKDNGYSLRRAVKEVAPGSQAELQGLKVGDEIMRINGVDLFGVQSRVYKQLLNTRKNEVEMIVRSKK
ncbi:hypothetical protein PMAYCL1PPCAC_09935 [Pristionchus mayeri]|uniref:PDZ domain-containing protein n=1 Tax=Pristionchus mayeri TaxID=1317129 RepID=A0AAN5CCK7_9BILA|nr:hypothetical protein PMAYCL1PPCAC_09935 [Pristionchus mayeri]